MNKDRKKILNGKCKICGFNRYLESCHIVPKRIGGGDNMFNKVILCPNHHKLLDYGLLKYDELKKIEDLLYPLIDRYKHNMKAQEYLYFLLGYRENAPKWLYTVRKVIQDKLNVDNVVEKS